MNKLVIWQRNASALIPNSRLYDLRKLISSVSPEKITSFQNNLQKSLLGVSEKVADNLNNATANSELPMYPLEPKILITVPTSKQTPAPKAVKS